MKAFNEKIILRNVAIDPSGGGKDLIAAINTPVTVYETGTTNLASLFDLDENQISNPTSTDIKGNVVFKVADGVYDIVGGTGENETRWDQVEIIDLTVPLDVKNIKHYTLAEAKALTGAVIGQIIQITDRGNGQFEFIAPTVNNEIDLIECVGSSLTLKAIDNGNMNARQLGVDGSSDQSLNMQRLVDISTNWIVDADTTVFAKNVIIPDGNKGTINGLWKMPDNSNANDWLFKANNSRDIDISGSGELNGNSSNQGWVAPAPVTNAPQGLFLFEDCTDCKVHLKKAGLNFIPNNTYFADTSDSAIRFKNGTRNTCIIENLDEFGREGVFFEEETHGIIEVWNSDGVNGVANQANIDAPSYPYSAARHTGVNSKYNIIRNSYAIRCGAASFALDSQFSKMYSLTSIDNAFFAGITFGHPGFPASNSIGYDLIVEGAGAVAQSNNAPGVQIQGDSENVTLFGINSNSNYGAGINVVGSSKDCNISDVESNANLGTGGHGINVSDLSTGVKLGGVISTNNNAQNGINSFAGNTDHTTATLRSKGNAGRSVAIRSGGAGAPITKEVIEAVQHKWVFDNLSTPAGTPLLELQHIDGATDSATIVEISYYQRNTGSTTPSNQFWAEKRYMLFGFGTARQIAEVNSNNQQRDIVATYTPATRKFNFKLTDIALADVGAGNTPNGLTIKINQHAKIFNNALIYLE